MCLSGGAAGPPTWRGRDAVKSKRLILNPTPAGRRDFLDERPERRGGQFSAAERRPGGVRTRARRAQAEAGARPPRGAVQRMTTESSLVRRAVPTARRRPLARPGAVTVNSVSWPDAVARTVNGDSGAARTSAVTLTP